MSGPTNPPHDFPPEKIEEFQAAFNYFDKDASGMISKDEYVHPFSSPIA
jgi:Ca2+-binding EF-hand superfamily protein